MNAIKMAIKTYKLETKWSKFFPFLTQFLSTLSWQRVRKDKQNIDFQIYEFVRGFLLIYGIFRAGSEGLIHYEAIEIGGR